ncbi:MAG: peptidoglycan DD-metalloendopeptidase family protein [Desulfobacteraceae bacterium]|nr:peptidoglycan DD-metalloendopeptidase family protein [Desulfobacteraceae bacterium]MBC2755109.1 peptidoglycan DD-metalloendopeptidase family protein [Desulfobacteraceae bacterium]
MFFFYQKIFKTVIFFGVLLSCLVMPVTAESLETREIGVVTVGRLNMRLGAGGGYPVIKVLEKDTQVQVLDHVKGWLQVLHDSDVGYVSSRNNYIKLHTIHSVSGGKRTDLDKATAKSDDINRKIKQQTAEVFKYNKQEKEVIAQLHKTDLTLNKARRQAGVIEAELVVVSGNISEMQKKVDQAQSAIDRNSGYAVNRVVSLYKLNKLGEVNLLASATSLHDLMKRRAAVKKILQYDYQVVGKLVEKKNDLAGLIDQQNQQKKKKESLNAEYQETIARLAKEQKQRNRLLAEIKQKKTNRLATIKYLKKASVNLDKTINALRQGSSFDQENINNFYAYQGLLKMPVNGKVISKYGKYVESHSGASSFRNGIEIQSKQGTPIRAVFSGQTIYSSWLKGYGNVIIIAHGKNFHTVYAHAEELFRSKGEQVETGEVIATVGDTGSMNGPSLYFEIRHQGNPIDPLEWINKS